MNFREQVCTGSITFSTLGAEVEKVFSKGHPTLFRGAGDLELWARAALKLCLNRTGHAALREPGGLGVMISAAWPWHSVWGAVWTAYLVGVRRQAGGWQIRRMWPERQRTCWHNAGWPERGDWAGSLMWMLMKGTTWNLNKNSQVYLLCMWCLHSANSCCIAFSGESLNFISISDHLLVIFGHVYFFFQLFKNQLVIVFNL